MKTRISIDKTQVNRGALDFSYLLDAPAGKHGFVKRKGEHLYFEDGTRARFLGFNMAARSNTPNHEDAKKLANRFASMGVNVIRLHAADAPIGDEPGSWSSCREAPLLDYESGSSRKFHREGLDRFDYFAAKLKERGIYLHIDLIVARDFGEGDELDYPGHLGSCIKCYTMLNRRLIELQKEYARYLLCHINPYTGLALIDDPAVMTIQINNEDSVIKGTQETDEREEVQPYRDERQKKFNDFLLMKYGNRENLEKSWIFEGVCALGEQEDPQKGTVHTVDGSFYQPVNDPTGAWDNPVSPARYADYMEFGIEMNRSFYREMKDFICSLGAKVPVTASNLMAGAADVYGHTDGDLMENNCYFNHPILPLPAPNTYLVPGPAEYVSTNPLTMQKGIGSLATSLISLAAVAVVRGKPFIISEWNEYGEHPFHSTAYIHTVAYAALNDWDGLILYNFHTSEKADDQPADEIVSVFDVYNDPAVICQWGFLAAVFLKGLIRPAKNRADVVFTANDVLTLPNMHAMPDTFLPYIMSMRNVFADADGHYAGDADLAVNAGFFNGADLSDAKRGVYYAWSPYRDAFRRCPEKKRLLEAAAGGVERREGVFLGEKTLVFSDIAQIAGSGDYREFASLLDQALKAWGILEEETGYVDGKLISDTKEICFDPDHARFTVLTPYCACFSGAPEPGEKISLSDEIFLEVKNRRITLELLPAEKDAAKKGGLTNLNEADAWILTALGETGMDETTSAPGPKIMGTELSVVTFAGKLFAETLEGKICLRSKRVTENCRLQILSPVGEVQKELEPQKEEGGVSFTLDQTVPGIQYLLKL